MSDVQKDAHEQRELQTASSPVLEVEAEDEVREVDTQERTR